MASIHETIAYTAGKLTELLDTTVLTGTIVSVDYVLDTARVNIGGTEYSNVPIFYHCYGSEEVAGGSVAFAEGDSVYVLNKEGSLTITGFVDGLKSCGWKFKLYRDDDTTIRDGNGNIKTPSGLLIDIWSFNGIYLFDADTTYGALPAVRGGGSDYWTYNSETGIWTYDDSVDYPNNWWKGTYNTNTGYFTIETMTESPDKLYWAEYSTAEPTESVGPGIDEATSIYMIDNFIGVVIQLHSTGNSQTLQTPTDITAGRTFIVMNNANSRSYTITVNGVILSAGEYQGFTWNGSSWETSEIDYPYALSVQYPYRYKTVDKGQVADKISMGAYEDNLPYFKAFGGGEYIPNLWRYSPTPVILEAQPNCENIDVLSLYSYSDYYYKTGYALYWGIKTSIPYYVRYAPYLSVLWYGNRLGGSTYCDEDLYCGALLVKTGSSEKEVNIISDDGVFNKTGTNWIAHIDYEDSPEKPRPGSIETLVEYSMKLTNLKLTDLGYYCRTVDISDTWKDSDLKYIEESSPAGQGLLIHFKYE